MIEWFSTVVEHERATFDRDPTKYYFIAVSESDKPGAVRWDIYSVLAGDVATLSEQWQLVEQDEKSLLPKLKRKGICDVL